MIKVEQIDLMNKQQVDDFVMLPFRLYKDCPQWVPPFINDIKLMLNKKKHPFYELNDADFFAVYRDGKMVGRIAAMENRSFNEYHKCKKAQFYLFDIENDHHLAFLKTFHQNPIAVKRRKTLWSNNSIQSASPNPFEYAFKESICRFLIIFNVK